jgi:uncharacterized protein (TIGR00296 family)
LPFELSLEEGKLLIGLARKSVEEYLKSKKRIEPPENISKKLLELCGVFVTINTIRKDKKELRGCIGFPYPTTPLAQAVIEAAISSATQDPRFYPLSLNELEKVVFEISVLTPPQLIKVDKATEYPKKIKIGRDGLIIERGMYKGLLLPQVPVEWNWNGEEFLCQCCIKAGLPPDNWLLNGTKIYRFQAIIFEEDTPKGEVKCKTLGGK